MLVRLRGRCHRVRAVISEWIGYHRISPSKSGTVPMHNAYETHLDKTQANYTPLTPLSLIARTAYVYPRHTAVVHGERRYTWAETYARSRRLASALSAAGIGLGD